MNNTTISGNAGQDPELRYFESGSCKVSFSLAVYAGKKDGQVQTTWYNIEAWGKVAESIARHTRKGTRLICNGVMKSDTYEKDGQKRTNWSLNVFEFGIVPKDDTAEEF